MDKFEIKKYLYYALIGVVSFVVLVFLPMLGTDVDLGFYLPNTFGGWSVYILTKLTCAILNMFIFYCFMNQARINVRNNENFKKANEILNNVKLFKQLKPRSPREWNKTQYGLKGTSIAIFSIVSSLVLTNAILTYDWISALTYFFVLVCGIIFGIVQMKSAEAYWTNEYYQYALFIEEESKNKLNLEVNKCLSAMIKNIEILKNRS